MPRLTKYANNKTCCTSFKNEECMRLKGNCSLCSVNDRAWDKLRAYEEFEESLMTALSGNDKDALWLNICKRRFIKDDGIDLANVKEKIDSCRNVFKEVSKVYNTITGGRINNALVSSEIVLEAANIELNIITDNVSNEVKRKVLDEIRNVYNRRRCD